MKKLSIILGLFIMVFIAGCSSENTISSLDLAEEYCPVGQGYKLDVDFDVPTYKGITPQQFFNTSFDVIENGEWCQLLVEGLPEAVAYECSFKEFKKSASYGNDVETVYAHACKGVFKSSLVTKKYYDKEVGKYYKNIQGKIVYIDENSISNSLEEQLN